MEVLLTPDAEQEAFIRHAIETGRVHRVEEAMQEAMGLWQERERRRSEILDAVERAEASLKQGSGRRVTSREEALNLAEEIKRRGLTRLTADSTAH